MPMARILELSPASRARFLVLALAMVVVAGLATGAGAAPTAHTAATCSDYATQADAQRAADTADPDHDGRYCVISPR